MITTLSNCNVTITGGLKKMKRKDAFALIRAEGGFPQKKITKSTNILIISDDQAKAIHHTDKYEKADRWFVETISEADFYRIVGA